MTQLRFNRATSDDINIEAGISQGSPLSPILFMLYNAELLEIPKAPDLALGFIDDIAYGISRLTAQRNIERLQVILSKSEKWKEKHGARVGIVPSRLSSRILGQTGRDAVE